MNLVKPQETQNMDYHPLYNAALDADSAFSRELTRVYGRNACNARYYATSSYTDARLIAADNAFKVASQAWCDYLAQSRKTA